MLKEILITKASVNELMQHYEEINITTKKRNTVALQFEKERPILFMFPANYKININEYLMELYRDFLTKRKLTMIAIKDNK